MSLRELGAAERAFYAEHHRRQTVESVQGSLRRYLALDRATMTMAEALRRMDRFVDPSDPDLGEPNSVHAYQTAEMIRRHRPSDTALQVTGLIHDLGKVLYQWGEPAWNVVGDTHVVGCAPPPPGAVVAHEAFAENPDASDPRYRGECGMYPPHCGIDRVLLSFGHDEYLYQVLLGNRGQHRLPLEYADIVRFHSFYPWHTHDAYRHLMTKADRNTLRAVRDFNRFDLYSKEDDAFEVTEEMRNYYGRLLREYFPEPLRW